jgi:hypothetical protein
VAPKLIEDLDAKEIMVIQSITGTLTVYTDPGPQWQGFGKVTKYPRQSQYSFCSILDEQTDTEVKCEGSTSNAKRVRFSEGGHAMLKGSVSWEMPLDTQSVLEIHRKFGSAEALESMAIGKSLDSAAYFSGPLMTSTESSGSRRGELVQYINDQASRGIFVTRSSQETIKDITGAKETVTITEIIRDPKTGLPQRQQGSIIEDFKLKLLPISINELKYNKVVEKQIADRQASTTQVQLAQATTLKAEQQAKTTEAEGKANAAQAKWAQETIKAQKVVEAQQAYEVAVLAAKEAEQYKRKQILIGEGDGAKARLVMQANGALEQKLATYKEVNEMYADAIAKHNGPLVPSTIIGGSGSGSGAPNSVTGLMDMFMVKTARDLGLDMSMKK